MRFTAAKKRTHDCPFLERGTKCTNKQHHKDVGGKHKDVYCGYDRCKNCPYYNESKSLIKDDSTPLKTSQEAKHE